MSRGPIPTPTPFARVTFTERWRPRIRMSKESNGACLTLVRTVVADGGRANWRRGRSPVSGRSARAAQQFHRIGEAVGTVGLVGALVAADPAREQRRIT